MEPIKNMPIKDALYAAGTLFLTILSIGAVVGIIIMITNTRRAGNIGGNTITVTASAEEYAVPDIAEFSITVREEGKDVAGTQTKVTNKINTVITEIKGLDVAKEDIQTQSISANPKYEWQNVRCAVGEYCPGGKQVLVGYTSEQTLRVVVRDLEKAPAVLQKLGTLNVTEFYGPNFTFEDKDAVKDLAREKAIEKAREKAKNMAKSMGVRLGKIVSFSEDGVYPVYPRNEMAMDMAVGASAKSVPAPTIEPGQSKVTSSVTIVYKIK